MPRRYKVLISGSSGMLGVDLVRELVKDYELCGMDLVNSQWSIVNSFNECDITDRKRVSEIVNDVRPDVIIHTAAWTDVDGCEANPDKAYSVNSRGTANVAAACKETGLSLIYISTDFVFDGNKKEPYTEKDTPHPISIYGDSKLKGEEAIKETIKDYFILRTSWLYGKYGKNFVDTIIDKAKTEKVLKVVNDQVGSPTFTKDLAKAIHILLGRHFNIREFGAGTYHVSNAGSISWYEYAKEILKLAGSDTKVVPVSSEELGRPAKRPGMSVLDNSKFIKFTGHKMRDWKDAVKEYVLEKTRESVC